MFTLYVIAYHYQSVMTRLLGYMSLSSTRFPRPLPMEMVYILMWIVLHLWSIFICFTASVGWFPLLVDFYSRGWDIFDSATLEKELGFCCYKLSSVVIHNILVKDILIARHGHIYLPHVQTFSSFLTRFTRLETLSMTVRVLNLYELTKDNPWSW